MAWVRPWQIRARNPPRRMQAISTPGMTTVRRRPRSKVTPESRISSATRIHSSGDAGAQSFAWICTCEGPPKVHGETIRCRTTKGLHSVYVKRSKPGLASERRFFGGLAFMLNGYICIVVVGHELTVRVGANQYAECRKLPHARPMEITGKSLAGFLKKKKKGFESDAGLLGWIERAVTFVSGLPPKG